MMLGRIVGTVWADTKDRALKGMKMRLMQPVNEKDISIGHALVAVDPLGLSTGDLVYWVGGPEGSVYRAGMSIPCDCLIVGLADRVNTCS